MDKQIGKIMAIIICAGVLIGAVTFIINLILK